MIRPNSIRPNSIQPNSIQPNNLAAIDFAALYREQKRASDFKPKTARDWDAKADGLSKNLGGIYPANFLAAIDTTGCESLLDAGCGAGVLTLALAERFRTIYALDFSQGMLDALMQTAQERMITNITPIKHDMEGDWGAIPPADLVIASRSLEVADMKPLLTALNAHARRRVYVSYKVGGSFLGADILGAIGRTVTPKPDYIYIVNILHQMGICASVQFIESEGKGLNAADLVSFTASVEWSLGALTGDEKRRLAEFYAVRKNRQEPKLIWALIGWNTTNEDEK